MHYLTPQAFARARDFLKTQARPLDRALFEVHFEQAAAERALAELEKFQNDDGGFGHALEPDMRTPSSSALATGIGLTVLKDLGCPAAHPLVRGAVAYLLQTFDAQQNIWRVIPRDANDHPHAPWWHDEDGSLARTFGGFPIIPRAQLIGLLHHYAKDVPAGWLQAVTERTVADSETLEDLGSGGGDDLRYTLSLAETPALPEAFRSRLRIRLRAIAPQTVSRDPQTWESYCIPPLKLAPSPDSIVADLLQDVMPAYLDYLIAHQTDAGTWEPTWTWGDFYPDVWPQAKLEWRGHLTLETLTSLQAYGRINSSSLSL